MWVTKIKIKHDCLFALKCKKFKVALSIISFYPYKKRNYIYLEHLGVLTGNPKNIKKYIEELKKDKRIEYLESEGNVFFVIEKRKFDKLTKNFLEKRFIYIKPIEVDTQGVETWEFASISKESLLKFINIYKEAELIYIKKIKLRDVYFPKLIFGLTPNQRKALLLAIKEGYYNYPRKTSLKELAKKYKTSISTFREHLRKAEKKVLGELII